MEEEEDRTDKRHNQIRKLPRYCGTVVQSILQHIIIIRERRDWKLDNMIICDLILKFLKNLCISDIYDHLKAAFKIVCYSWQGTNCEVTRLVGFQSPWLTWNSPGTVSAHNTDWSWKGGLGSQHLLEREKHPPELLCTLQGLTRK